jgi:uncharacterized protein YqgQ
MKYFYFPLKHESDLAEINYLNEILGKIESKILKDLFKGLEVKFSELDDHIILLKKQVKISNLDLLDEKQLKLAELKDLFEDRVDSLLGRLEQSSLFPDIDEFFMNPDLSAGTRILGILKEKIGICEFHGFERILEKFNKKFTKMTKIQVEMTEIDKNLSDLGNMLLNKDYGLILEKIPPLLIQINGTKSSQLLKIYTKILDDSQEGYNKSQVEIYKMLEETVNLMNKNDYIQARLTLTSANNVFKTSVYSSGIEKIDEIDFDLYGQNIGEHEREFTIYKILLEFADKYPRVLLLEIINKSDLDPDVVEPIVKNLISNGKIRAEFDDETKGIEFKFAVDEIDALMKVYGDWERGKDKK